MSAKKIRNRNRVDHQIIADLIDPGSRLLDLGCGNGNLLKILIQEKKVKGVGIEKDLDMVKKCLEKGISVYHRNLDEGIAHYPENQFDYIVLSLTLQALKHPDETIREMVRIGKKAIVSFPNFGNIKIRFDLLFKGKMPKSRFLPYEWYNTPNIHFCSVKDFKDFCRNENIKIVNEIFLKKMNRKILGIWPNLFASLAIFVLET